MRMYTKYVGNAIKFGWPYNIYQVSNLKFSQYNVFLNLCRLMWGLQMLQMRGFNIKLEADYVCRVRLFIYNLYTP